MSAASLTSGMSTGTVFLIERRQTLPRIDTIEKFAVALGVSASWLAYGDGAEDDEPKKWSAAGIGERLESVRKQRGLSRQALGRAAGITGQSVANIAARGMMPRVDNVEMLARALEVSASWLAFGVDPSSLGKPSKKNSAAAKYEEDFGHPWTRCS